MGPFKSKEPIRNGFNLNRKEKVKHTLYINLYREVEPGSEKINSVPTPSVLITSMFSPCA